MRDTPVANDGCRITHQREAADVVRVRLTGEFDLDNAPQLTHALLPTVRAADVARVVVDMGGAVRSAGPAGWGPRSGAASLRCRRQGHSGDALRQACRADRR